MTNITIRDLIASFNFMMPILNIQTDRDDIAPDLDRAALHALDDRLASIYNTLDDTRQTHLAYILDDFHDDPFYHLSNSDRFNRPPTDPDSFPFPSIADFTDADLDLIITDDDLRSMIENEFADHTETNCDYCDN